MPDATDFVCLSYLFGSMLRRVRHAWHTGEVCGALVTAHQINLINKEVLVKNSRISREMPKVAPLHGCWSVAGPKGSMTAQHCTSFVVLSLVVGIAVCTGVA